MNSVIKEQAGENQVPFKENKQINRSLIELVLPLCVQTRTIGNKVCEPSLHHSLPIRTEPDCEVNLPILRMETLSLLTCWQQYNCPCSDLLV